MGLVAGLIPAWASLAAQAEEMVEIISRGLTIPAIVLKPGGPIKGGVVLLAGSSGRLDIKDGAIGKLRRNQLVRSRQLYRQAGYLTLLPDIAPDMKRGASGVAKQYRASAADAQDIGAMVAYLKQHGAAKVWLVGTSRGTLSAANAVARLKGDPQRRPDGAVLSSGFWALGPDTKGSSIWKVAKGDAASLRAPILLIRNMSDSCRFTLPAMLPAFAGWLKSGGASVTVRDFSGGLPAISEPCKARSPHGFYGLDAEVVKATTTWMGQDR